MRNLIVGLTLLFASPVFSADLAEGWASLGQINAQVDGEDLDMTVVSGPDGSPHAFQIDAGGPKIVRVQGYVVSDSGTPATQMTPSSTSSPSLDASRRHASD